MGTTNHQISERFANGARDGQNATGSIYIDNNTIYSYGSHFPIATRFAGCALITTDTYSVTTSAHVTNVWRALNNTGRELFHVPNVLASTRDDHEGNFAYYIEEVKTCILKAKRARVNKAFWELEANRYKMCAIKYAERFNLGIVSDYLEAERKERAIEDCPIIGHPPAFPDPRNESEALGTGAIKR